MKSVHKFGLLVVVCLVSSLASADSLELKNGSLIKGKFIGGTETEITFKVGSSVQRYNVADVVSIKFDAEAQPLEPRPQPSTSYSSEPARPQPSPSYSSEPARPTVPATATAGSYVTVPAGTRISVRTIDAIDSTQNRVGDRFQASLEEPLMVNGNVVAAKGTDVYGRLTESKASGTFSGKSELQLELTGIVVNGRTIPIVTGEYEMVGKSRGASTAKRSVGGAAVGTIIGAIAGGGKGAAIGAGVGAGVGAGSQIITKGDQVKVPSETLLEFTLQQEVSLPAPQS